MLEANTESWRPQKTKRRTEPGQGTWKIFACDRRDLKAVASLVRRGKYSEALSLIDCLDTIVRDRVPAQLKYLLETTTPC